MRICVIIPTFNESKKITGLIQQIRGQGFDILVVDDGSRDNTAELARGAGAAVIKNETNLGKGASLAKGFDYGLKNGFDAVLTMDGDGQHLPDDIPFFIRLAEFSDSAVLVGNRMHKPKNMPPLRLATNKFMSWLISMVAGQDISDTQCGFRLIKRQVLEKVKLETVKFEIESELLIKASHAGFKIESVPIHSVYAGEKSQINPFIDSLRFFKFIFRMLWISRS